MDQKTKEKELGSYIGRLLRDHFGKGPGVVFATIATPFITMYIKEFLTPIETKLLDMDQSTHVQKTRDLLMKTLIDEIKAYISINLGIEVKEFYYDWNLETHSGLFIAICPEAKNSHIAYYPNQQQLHNEIIKVSEEAQKAPGKVNSYLLNPRTLVIVREKILIMIEKELASLNFVETLTVAKRNLEKRLIHNHREGFEAALNSRLENTFTTWNFEQDKCIAIFILQPYK